jgi:hypothetical protein
MTLKRNSLFAIALISGLLTLVGLLTGFSSAADLVLNWAGFLAAVALLLGVINLLSVHVNRSFSNRDLGSGALVVSMVAVFVLAITDSDTVGLTEDGVASAFNWIQAPLEAALASLLAFFLLYAGFRLLRTRRNGWTVLFLLVAVLMLASNALISSTLLPEQITTSIEQVRITINGILVASGIRGILIGVALGTITISLRLLIGLDRPYS